MSHDVELRQSGRAFGERSRVALLALGTVAALSVAAGCQASGGASASADRSTSGSPHASASSAAPAKPEITVSPAQSSTGIGANKPVTVTAADGALSSVTVTDSKGAAVTGKFDGTKAHWNSSGSLVLGATYQVKATAENAAGGRATNTSTFSTLKPKALVYPNVIPLRNETVGVGMVIRVMFNHNVGDKAATEKLLKVTPNKPVVGAWHWFGDNEVHWRPKKYWPAHTKVALDINIGGKDLGNGVYGQESRHIPFTVGNSMVTKVSNATKTLKSYKNGKLAKTVPVSLGKAKNPSYSGVQLVMTDQHDYTMNSATFGVPPDAKGGYKTTVKYAIRLTNSGQFLHSAPWSVRQQGHTNVSHGCININTAAAKWFYENSHRGDVVDVTGTGHTLKPGDGWTDWRFNWADWKAGSALS